MDFISQLPVAGHLHHQLLEGVLLLQELGNILLSLLGHQRSILIIETDMLQRFSAFCTNYPSDLLLLVLQDLWQDDGLQNTLCFWARLELAEYKVCKYMKY